MSEIHFVASKFEFLCHLTYKMYLQIVGNTYKVLQINLIGMYFSLVISEISMTNMSVFVARRQEKLLLYSLWSKRFRWAFCTKEIFFFALFCLLSFWVSHTKRHGNVVSCADVLQVRLTLLEEKHVASPKNICA